MISFQDNLITSVSSNQTAGVTTTPLDTVPSVSAPFYMALDCANANGHFEVIYVTSKTATNINHAATTYAHTTSEEVRLITPSTFLNTIQQLPEGGMYNGQIVPSVASNNLTVALKTKAGTDPSVTDPVYAMIGGELRIITAALSVTKNAGTNWCNAGSSELATEEIDYFAYLGYNATDGVVIGFSRYPGANQYNDFSATTTNEKYCAISTITNAASTDYYEVIGRFAATLSAGAGYTWSVPTYTAVNLIQKPIYETRWLTFTTVFTTTGTAPTFTATNQNRYKIVGNTLYFNSSLQNTSGGTAGSGANDLYQNLPFSGASRPSTNRGALGIGAATGAANSIRLISYRDVNTIAFQSATLVNLLCSDLNTVARELYSDGKMQI